MSYVRWKVVPKLEAQRRRTRGRRVSSEYVAQRWTATVPNSDQLCCLRWKSGRRARRDKIVLLRRDSSRLACRCCTAHAVWWAASDDPLARVWNDDLMNWKRVAQQLWALTADVEYRALEVPRTRRYSTVVKPTEHKTGDKCVECMRRQRLLDGSYLSQCTETRRQDMVDVDTKISRRLDWAHVRTNLDVVAWNVVATTDRCTPDALRLERVQLQSAAARPLQYIIYAIWHAISCSGTVSCGWHHPYTWVSSAYRWQCRLCFWISGARSAVYNTNSNGPRTEPCGTRTWCCRSRVHDALPPSCNIRTDPS